MQIIHLVGNLTADAEVKTGTRKGVPNEFVTFKLACNDQRGDERTTTFYDVTCAKTGVLNYLKKGQKVVVYGPFRFTTTEDSNGNRYDHLNVGAIGVELAGGPTRKDEEDIPEM